MPIEKIDDSVLENEGRFHITQPDLPTLDADSMKAFMDHIPRNVIIPKLNEVIDVVQTKADSADTAREIALKADSANVYTKDDTYTKTEVDTKFKSTAILINTKANTVDVYSKTDIDKELATLEEGVIVQKSKGETGHTHGKIYSNGTAPYIKSSGLVLLNDGSIYDCFGDIPGNLPCVYSTVSELESFIDSIYKGEDIVLFSGKNGECDAYITKNENDYVLLLGHDDFLTNISLESWVYGSNYICEYLAYSYSCSEVKFTDIGRYLCATRGETLSDIATKAYVDEKLSELRIAFFTGGSI